MRAEYEGMYRGGREKGRPPLPQPVQKVNEGNTSYGLSWRVKAMVQNKTSILQVPTTQLAKMSIGPKFVELTADVLRILFLKIHRK